MKQGVGDLLKHRYYNHIALLIQIDSDMGYYRVEWVDGYKELSTFYQEEEMNYWFINITKGNK
jgi:hypothetical protein